MAQPRKTASKRVTAKGTQPKSRITSASDWKSNARTPVELELPSGNICLAINKGMKVFLSEGNVPNSLMDIVQGAIAEGEGKGQKKLAEAAEDTKVLGDMIHMMDGIVVSCVMQPDIAPVPLKEDGTWDEAAKDPSLLYVDEVELEDKMFIFQWCVGGTTDIAQFRKEFASAVESVQGS